MPAAAYVRVKPTKVSVVLFSVLPVLPATGRPPKMPATCCAVPPSHLPKVACSPTGHRAASVAARATSGEITCRQLLAAGVLRPCGAVIESSGDGAQPLPSAATVAYAEARSSGGTSITPRVKAP